MKLYSAMRCEKAECKIRDMYHLCGSEDNERGEARLSMILEYLLGPSVILCRELDMLATRTQVVCSSYDVWDSETRTV